MSLFGEKMMVRWKALLVIASLPLAACSQQDSASAPANTVTPVDTAAPSDSKDYYTALPMNEFMPHVMQYAADGIWKRQGYVITEDGEKSLFPTNSEEWETAESAALALAEMTNVLLLPGRRVDDPQWINPVKQVRTLALEAAAAAERQDADAWFEAGGKLDAACESCHVVYDTASTKAKEAADAEAAAGAKAKTE